MPNKIAVTLPLSQEVIDFFKAQGDDWKERINDVLREYVAKHS